MPKVIGGLAALVALAAGILASVEPITCLMRGIGAFVLGCFGTQVWYVFFAARVQSSAADDQDFEDDLAEAA